MRILFTAPVLALILATPGLFAQQSKDPAPPSEKSPAAKDRAAATRQTPFGRVKQDANPEPPPEPKKPSETGLVKAEIKGNTVTFRKKTPFGNQVWKKKRSELSDDEEKILADQPGSKGANSAAKPAPVPAPKAAPAGAPTDEVTAKPEKRP